MACRKFYLQVIVRVVLISLNAFLFFLLFFSFPNISLLILAGAAIILQTLILIRYINRINVKISNFFAAYLSGETTSSFVHGKPGGEFGKLQDYFTMVNNRIEMARKEMEVNGNYFRTLADQTRVGLISFTSDGKVRFINDAVRGIFRLHVLRDLDKLDARKPGFSRLLLKLEPGMNEMVTMVIDGEMVQLSIKKSVIKTESLELHLVAIQNIKEELEAKEMESWQKLTRVLTHEIMNSMTPITSMVNTVSRIYRNQKTGMVVNPRDLTPAAIDKTITGLELVERRGNGLVSFLWKFRDINKLPKPQFQLVNLRKFLVGIQGLFEEQLMAAGIRMTIVCNPVLEMHADDKLMEQVLINLVKNAVEAVSGRMDPTIKLSAYSSGERTVIDVEDNGKGIPEAAMENIFVPFFTTKEKGSGIGLSLSRQIIHMHGGILDFNSIPGNRTVFTIRI